MQKLNEILQKINIINTTNYDLLSILFESAIIFIIYYILKKINKLKIT